MEIYEDEHTSHFELSREYHKKSSVDFLSTELLAFLWYVLQETYCAYI